MIRNHIRLFCLLALATWCLVLSGLPGQAQLGGVNDIDICAEFEQLEADLRKEMSQGGGSPQAAQMLQTQLNMVRQQCMLKHQAGQRSPVPAGQNKPIQAKTEKYRIFIEQHQEISFHSPQQNTRVQFNAVKKAQADLVVRSDRLRVEGNGTLSYSSKGFFQSPQCQTDFSAEPVTHPARILADRDPEKNTLNVMLDDFDSGLQARTDASVQCPMAASFIDTGFTNDSVTINNVPIRDGGEITDTFQVPGYHNRIVTRARLQRLP